MQIDRLAAVIRPRTPWEGLDLGFALGRRWFATLLGLWLLTALPIALLGAIWLGDSASSWILLVWWFKPLYEAPLLFWLSRRLFGETLGLRELWQLRRQILPLRLLPNLLWRRLHPSRSFQMPLIQLEGLGGKGRRQRQRVLQGSGGASAWLTIICVHLESILWLSALLLAAAMIPAELPGLDLSAAVLDEGSAPYWISSLVFWLAMSVIAPFYVAAGFALYLTRRTELEAWDLELRFRQVAEAPRHRDRGARMPVVVLIALAAGVSCLLPGLADALDLTREQAAAEIGAVLDSEDFGRTRTVQNWVYVDQQGASDEEFEWPDWLIDLGQALGRGGEIASVIIKWLLYFAAAVLVLVLVQRIHRDWRGFGRRKHESSSETPATVVLIPDAEAVLPADIPAAVDALIDCGDLRGALALLYAASIALLRRRYGLTVKASATELECLALVLDKRPAGDGMLMRRLVQAWQRLAYGHLEPTVDELDALVLDWQRWEGGGDEG